MNPANSFTARLFIDAGIRSGSRVLDLGCGGGDVSMLSAGLVGPEGAVVGIDRDADAVAHARARVPQNVEILAVDLDDYVIRPDSFDAIVTRRVLMYLPAPAATLRRFVPALRPGGVLVVQEHDATAIPAGHPRLALHDQVIGWMWSTVAREGGDPHIGFALPRLIEDAGLVVEHVRAEAVVRTPHDPDALAPIIRAMLPRIVAHGVATAAEVDVETLGDRLLAERRDARATYITDLAFGVWARRPAG